jgi:hypothetical protein
MAVTDPKFNPSNNQVVAGLKEGALNMEQFILDNIPEGRRRQIALTKLEDFSMWAVKAAAVGGE